VRHPPPLGRGFAGSRRLCRQAAWKSERGKTMLDITATTPQSMQSAHAQHAPLPQNYQITCMHPKTYRMTVGDSTIASVEVQQHLAHVRKAA
jgi:hypothetical protein